MNCSCSSVSLLPSLSTTSTSTKQYGGTHHLTLHPIRHWWVSYILLCSCIIFQIAEVRDMHRLFCSCIVTPTGRTQHYITAFTKMHSFNKGKYIQQLLNLNICGWLVLTLTKGPFSLCCCHSCCAGNAERGQRKQERILDLYISPLSCLKGLFVYVISF